jgi:hypothetical protein
MTTDPLAGIRALKDQALAQLNTGSLLDEYERGAIEITWEDLTGEGSSPSFAGPSLRVEMTGMRMPDAYATGKVTIAIQQATARLAKSIRNPSARSDVRREDRERAQLVQRSQIGNVVTFGFADDELAGPGVGLFDGLEIRSLAETAALGLVQRLPESAEDDRALDAILAGSPATRRAISEVVEAARTASGLTLTYATPQGETARSSLTAEQAGLLHDSLAVTSQEVTRETIVGLLEGMRTRRRMFYLIREDGTEIDGAIDENLLAEAKADLDKRVTAVVESSRTQTVGGRHGKKVYRLLSIRREPELFEQV